MRFLIIMAISIGTAIAKAEVKAFNQMIQEATLSEKVLRKKLLRILNNSEVAIAANHRAERYQQQSPSPDFEVRMVQARQ